MDSKDLLTKSYVGKAETKTDDSRLDHRRKLKDSDNGKFWKGFEGSNGVRPLEKIGGADGTV
jgi:hypothetical protein